MACMSPVVRQQGCKRIVHSCGRCPNCLKRKRNDWVLRFYTELKKHECSSFVTLTYDDEHAPRNDLGWTCLDKSHFVSLVKKLRKSGETFKYYCIGEYGTRTFRAHYHAFIFGMDKYDLWPLLYACWPYGNVRVADINGNRIGYIANYHVVASPTDYEKTEQNRCFTLSSKDLGVPSKEMLQFIVDHGYVSHNGLPYAIPRYWLEMLPKEEQLLISSRAKQYFRKLEQSQSVDIEQFKLKRLRQFEYAKHFSYKSRKNRK